MLNSAPKLHKLMPEIPYVRCPQIMRNEKNVPKIG
jgi:hypothetical protein